MIRAGIIGASGYTGGELLRLLTAHSQVDVVQATSRELAGKLVESVHPNLRSRSGLRFEKPDRLTECDVRFLCLPHGQAAAQIETLVQGTEHVIDLSADFRIKDPESYARWYGSEHPAPSWLDRFVYGLPETRREQLAGARFVSGVGCNATAMNLALLPFARANLIERAVVDLKVGSSQSGNTPGPGSHHPVRSGAVRTFAPAGHRHEAEVEQELGRFDLHVTGTAIDMVRGVLATAHVFTTHPLDDQEARRIFVRTCADEPFIRLVRSRGTNRFPEPKILAGTNFCDIGLSAEPESNRIVVVAAIDNLMKGAAGSAVQCMNIMCGLDETIGLGFVGLHPC